MFSWSCSSPPPAAAPFYFGDFMDRSQADLTTVLQFPSVAVSGLHPGDRHASVGRRAPAGTMELLMTLPITPWQAVIGKFLAAWGFAGIALPSPSRSSGRSTISATRTTASSSPAISASFLMAGALIAADLLRLGADQEPGRRLRHQRRDRLPADGGRPRSGDRCILLLGAGLSCSPRRLLLLPDPLPRA